MPSSITKQSNSSVGLRAYILLLSFIVLFLAFMHYLPSDILIAAKRLPPPRKVVHWDDTVVKAPTVADLPLGSEFPKDGVAQAIRNSFREHPSSRGYFIVGMGDCASCLNFDMDNWQKQAHQLGIPLAGYTLADVKRIGRFKKDLHSSIPIYSDPGNVLHKLLQANWSGRVYYYDRNWKLLWRMADYNKGQDLLKEKDLLSVISSEDKLK